MCLYLSLGQKHLHVKLTLSVPSRRLLSFPTYEAVLIACLRLVTTPPRAFLWVSGASFHLGRWSLVRLSNPPPSLSMLSVFRRRGSWSPASCRRCPVCPPALCQNEHQCAEEKRCPIVRCTKGRNPARVPSAWRRQRLRPRMESRGVPVGSPSESGWGQSLAGSLPLSAL